MQDKAAVKIDSARRQNKTAASSIFLVYTRTPIRHYSPVCGATAWTDLSVCIGISPLPGSPRAAPIACGVFHARTVAEQKYHDRRYGSWRAPGARRTANVSMLPDMRLSRFSRKCPPISSDKKRTNSAVLLAQKDLQFAYAGVNRPPYRTFANALRFCYLQIVHLQGKVLVYPLLLLWGQTGERRCQSLSFQETLVHCFGRWHKA